MASSLNAITTGTGGIVGTGDNSGVLDLQSAGVTKASITSAGLNVVGTFTINGSAPASSQWTTSGSDIYYSTGSVGIGNSSMSSFNSSYNNLVVGTGTGNEGLAIYAGSTSSCYLGFKGAASTTAQGLMEYDCSANRLYTYVNGALATNIDSSGQWYLGCTVRPSSGNVTGVMIEPGIITIGSTTTAGQDRMRFETPNGRVGSIVTTGSATVYNTSSDYRLKTNIAPMTGALAKVSLLKPVTYSWKVDGELGEGFIAHELQEVMPQCVTGEKDAIDAEGNPSYQGIDTSFLVATLTAAIQEQQALIENLTTRLAALEAK